MRWQPSPISQRAGSSTPIRWAARAQVPQDVTDRFYKGERTDKVRFVVNDTVRVKSGTHSGRTAAVISIVALEPDTVFLVEPGSPPFGDLCVPQSDLELLE